MIRCTGAKKYKKRCSARTCRKTEPSNEILITHLSQQARRFYDYKNTRISWALAASSEGIVTQIWCTFFSSFSRNLINALLQMSTVMFSYYTFCFSTCSRLLFQHFFFVCCPAICFRLVDSRWDRIFCWPFQINESCGSSQSLAVRSTHETKAMWYTSLAQQKANMFSSKEIWMPEIQRRRQPSFKV